MTALSWLLLCIGAVFLAGIFFLAITAMRAAAEGRHMGAEMARRVAQDPGLLRKAVHALDHPGEIDADSLDRLRGIEEDVRNELTRP